MDISLNPHFEQLIKAKVDSGTCGLMRCGGTFRKVSTVVNQPPWTFKARGRKRLAGQDSAEASNLWFF